MPAVDIVDGLTTRWLAPTRAITFEYLALTQGEAGLPVPQDIRDLPEPLHAVLASLAERHRPPGALLLAVLGDIVGGTVAMRRSQLTADTDVVVQRLYVRQSLRRRGLATELMAAAHAVAAREGFRRLVLNVMTSRTGALAFYRRLGYTSLTEPVDWPYGGVWLGRHVNS